MSFQVEDPNKISTEADVHDRHELLGPKFPVAENSLLREILTHELGKRVHYFTEEEIKDSWASFSRSCPRLKFPLAVHSKIQQSD